MSAFDRHPRRKAYGAAAKQFGLSPQNLKVRFAVDLEEARAKGNGGGNTRQVRRQVARLGAGSYAVNVQQGPEEV